jgi:4-hydroxy-4-methyl-2-oxoglutarate aldolase
MNDELLQRLRRLDACAVSDALDRVGIPDQVASGLPRQSTDRRVCGRAVTYRLVPAGEAPPQQGPVRHLGTTAVSLAGPDHVIVVEQRTGIDAGSWGGILSLSASIKGIAGVVADGPVRDIEEARAYDLPVYCRSLTARTARGRVEEASVNEPVCIGGVTVAAGDLVMADASGVVVVPAARAEEVIAAAELIAGREAAMAKDLLAGLPVTDVMGKNYEHMLRPDAA